MTSQPPPRERSAMTPARRTARREQPRPAQPEARPAAQGQRLPDSGHKSIVPKKAPGAGWHGHHLILLEGSLVLALLVLIGLLHAPMQFERAFVIPVSEQEIVEMEEITQTKQLEQPPPPPRPPVPVEVPNDAVLDAEVELNLDATLDINEPLADLPPPPPPPEEAEEATEAEDVEIFVAVEQMPELIGGMQGITARLQYPEVARLAGVEGRVIIQFVIDEEGRVRDAVVIQGQGAGLDEEALRVVRTARFKPGRQRGKPVKVRMSIPITFHLRDVQ